LAAVIVVATGCTPTFTEKARYGVTFYCPGAGNIDFGDSGLRAGLEEAGYEGEVATVIWTVSLNPAIDQTVRINARIAGRRLARAIEKYVDEFGRREGALVNVVGLSAGSGVAVWALEDLKDGYQVDNVVLLASSLSHRYDVSEALPKIRGRLYNFYSPNDVILSGPMKIFGTIDGVFFEDGAGAVGLRPPGNSGKVVNVGWRPEFQRYGYYGGHIDVTSPEFVRAQIAPRIIGPPAEGAGETGVPSRLAQGPRGERPD